MPIKYFGFYSLLQPYISTYYMLNKYKKGNKLFKNLSHKYQQNLNYYSKLSKSKASNFSIYSYAENIITDTERYRSLLESVLNTNDINFIGEAIENFVKSTDFVKEIYGDYEYFTLLTPFLEYLYKSGNINLSKDLYLNISNQLKDRLSLFIEMPQENKSEYVENIANNLFEYSKILNVLKDYEEDRSLITSEIKSFMKIKEKLTN